MMVAFVKTLKEIVPRPSSLVLMNGGVKLAVQGSELVEAIAELEGLGVEVLVCGTCLDFYKLTGEVAAGTVSNTFEILSVLAAADSVLSP